MYVDPPIWLQLPEEAKAVILASYKKKTAEQHRKVNATHMAYGKVQIPAALWLQIPPGAQSAITAHNNSVTHGSTSNSNQSNENTQVLNATQVAQMMGLIPLTNPFNRLTAMGNNLPLLTTLLTNNNKVQHLYLPIQPSLFFSR